MAVKFRDYYETLEVPRGASGEEIRKAFAKVFPVVGEYWSLVPSFGGYSGFCWGSKGSAVSLDLPSSAHGLGLRYLNGTTYKLGLGDLPFRLTPS